LAKQDGSRGTATCRWLVDASGAAAILARKNGWFRTNSDHPIASCWSRWKNVKSWDSQELADRFPDWAKRTCAIRLTATNHVVGKGWWSCGFPSRAAMSAWELSTINVLSNFPKATTRRPFKTFLEQHPVARELLSDAEWTEGDVHFRRNCAYSSTRFAGNGFALVGDSAAFIDPFYSPGMDWIAFTTSATATLIDSCIRGRPAAERVAAHNAKFEQSYKRWFEGIYRDKYFYMGDHELMTLAFRLDLGLDDIGVVKPPFRQGPNALDTPAFARPGSAAYLEFIAFYNRRLSAIARSRMERGTWGARNNNRYVSFMSYQLDWHLPRRVLAAIASWGLLELREGWRTWLKAPAFPSKLSEQSLVPFSEIIPTEPASTPLV